MFRHANGDLGLRNVQLQRAMRPFPERKSARPVGVHLVRLGRMADAMHARGYDNPTSLRSSHSGRRRLEWCSGTPNEVNRCHSASVRGVTPISSACNA